MVAAVAVVVAVGDGAIGAERLPQLAAVAGGIPAAAALDLQAAHAGRLQGSLIGRGDAPLALALADRGAALALQQHTLEACLLHPAVGLAAGAADGGHVVVLGAAVVTEVHGGGGIGVGEPAGAVAPAQQQREVERLAGGVAQRPHEHRQRVAAALVVAGQDRAEGLAAHLGIEHALVAGPAQRIAGGVGAGAAQIAVAVCAAGGVPAPAAQGFTGLGAGGIGLGFHRQGVGAAAAAVVLEQGELAVGQGAEPVLAAIEVPEVEGAVGAAADAAGAEAPQGHAVVGAVVEVAGVAHGVGRLPAQPEWAAPAGLRRLPGPSRGGPWAGAAEAGAAQQGFQGGEAEARHGAG